jgi:hypothetical protein
MNKKYFFLIGDSRIPHRCTSKRHESYQQLRKGNRRWGWFFSVYWSFEAELHVGSDTGSSQQSHRQ